MEPESPARRYAPFVAVFTLFAGLLTQLAADRREQIAASPLELGEGALATFFLTRTIAREKIGSVVREPFVEPAPGTDPYDAHGETKQPTGEGVRFAVGELVTCTRWLGPWIAAAVTFGRVFAPRQARVATRIAALGGANSIMHAVFAAIAACSNGSEDRSGNPSPTSVSRRATELSA